MSKLSGISREVKRILTVDEDARNSDQILYLHFIRDYCKKYDFDIETMTLPMWCLHGRDLGIPTIESVGRCRRKVQEHNPELRATKLVKYCRDELEYEFREWARNS